MIDLKGKVAIVTGAASGIGRSSATAMAAQGAAVLIADINGPGAEAVAAELRGRGLTAIPLTVDVAHEPQIEAMVAKAVEEFGGLNILHNNAALFAPEVLAKDLTVVELDAEVFIRVLRVNVLGYALGAKYAIPAMIRGGGGVIINTASTTGHASESSRPMYGTSKAALLGLTRNIATHHGKQGIRCVSISPGIIVTPNVASALPADYLEHTLVHNLNTRLGRPEDIGNLVAFLASDEAGFITGVDIRADGGLLSHFPGYAEEFENPLELQL
jgi:NAD(P)-dependent dehydrogenase (short-subunit alcohol dehydrogenase family)